MSCVAVATQRESEDFNTLTFDVTTLVKAWLDGAIENNGVALELGEQDQHLLTIASSEHSNPQYRPAVVLTMK